MEVDLGILRDRLTNLGLVPGCAEPEFAFIATKVPGIPKFAHLPSSFTLHLFGYPSTIIGSPLMWMGNISA